MQKLKIFALAAAFLCGASNAVMAADTAAAVQEVPTFVFSGGVGYIDMKANEYVWSGDSRVSQLIWESKSPVLSAGMTARFGGGWTLALEGDVAFKGKNYMEDYDWLAPFAVSDGWNDWTHQSQHPDTSLGHYFSGSVALGKDFAVNDQFTVNFNGGFKYTDVKWNARGGSFIYSEGGFRDSVGNFPDVPGISYQQKHPVAFAGIDVSWVRDRWTFGASARGGVAFNSTAIDHHWMRDLRFDEDYRTAPVLMLAGRVDYAMTERMGVFVSGAYDRIFPVRADTALFGIPNGEPLGAEANSGGGSFRSAKISLGLKSAF